MNSATVSAFSCYCKSLTNSLNMFDCLKAANDFKFH